MKITMNGLSNEEFQEIRNKLCKDAEQLLAIAYSTTGHLGDIVSGIRTTQSSIDIKAKKLWEMFEEQKL
jgi:hypothetical protein